MALQTPIGGNIVGFGVPDILKAAGGAVLGAVVRGIAGAGGQDQRNAFRTGPEIDILSQAEASRCNGDFSKRFKIDPCTGNLVEVKTRRRRKRMLTCSDKVDIAFVTGTLGKGQIASAAISSLLSRCA